MNKKLTVSHRGLPRVFLYQRCQTTLCLSFFFRHCKSMKTFRTLKGQSSAL